VEVLEHPNGQYSVGTGPFKAIICKNREAVDKLIEEIKLWQAPRLVQVELRKLDASVRDQVAAMAEAEKSVRPSLVVDKDTAEVTIIIQPPIIEEKVKIVQSEPEITEHKVKIVR
jgi:hypothetical protein